MAKQYNPDLADGQASPATAALVEAKNAGSLESKNFLDYPFEIRVMIYKDFFATESFESREARLELGSKEGISQLSRRMTAHDKVSLLLANKAILGVASSFLYRLHEFRLLLPDQRETILTNSFGLPYRIEQILREIAKVRLVDLGTELENSCSVNLLLTLELLYKACPNLKSITADIVIQPDNPKPYEVPVLQNLWPRLNHLQLVTRYFNSRYTDPYLQSIVPGLKWSCHKTAKQTAKVYYDGVQITCWKKVFFIDRAHLVEGVTEIDDESPPTSDDDASIGSGDDASVDSGDDVSV